MWQTENDLRTHIRDLNSGAGDHYARLIDTITETDGSAESREPLLGQLMNRIKRAVQRMGGDSQPTISGPASVESPN
jgi:hypothetical protein